ncbi:pilus assembly protein TadG-related protein [Geomonas subterranea]|uniref:pilus assembly protein TadG-related protein n=1 Tax=Geomonas subterranea TaxID=2847989 RepID=UPI001CD620F9|nr:pilus assembly protein TadG-related protein [Geomonas fuzhouensis]
MSGKNEKGFALVYIALMIVVLVGFVSLAVDLGYMYVTKGQLQNAADAGALAGVAKLSDAAAARQSAKQFAEQNKAAGEAVKVALNDANNANGDIVIGYWDKKTSALVTPVPFGKVANAVKVVARRTEETGDGISTENKQVSIFFGKVLNWGEMSAKAEAIACRPAKPSAPIVLCMDLCGTTVFPFKVYFNQTLAVDPSGVPDAKYTVGWTEFSATSKATELGKNGTVSKLIQDPEHEIPLGLCGQTLWTNNGLGTAIDVLHDTYMDAREPVSKIWTLLVPIFEFCPSSVSSGEKFTTLVQYAEIGISEVKGPGGGSGESYIEIQSISCESCSTTNFLGDKATLVK